MTLDHATAAQSAGAKFYRGAFQVAHPTMPGPSAAAITASTVSVHGGNHFGLSAFAKVYPP